MAAQLFVLDPSVFTPQSVHVILAASAVIQAKSSDDHVFDNVYYAKCAGLSLRRLNAAELELLTRLNFKVFLNTNQFDAHRRVLDGLLNDDFNPSLAVEYYSAMAPHFGFPSIIEMVADTDVLTLQIQGENKEGLAASEGSRMTTTVMRIGSVG
jgi:hypothetical protein